MVIQKEVKSLFELAKAATYHHVISQIEYQLRSSSTSENSTTERPPEKEKKSIHLLSTSCLTAKKPKDVKRSSRIAKFHPYWDPVDRFIKLRGRTGLSNVLEESPNLPLIPATAPKDIKVFHLVE